MLLSEALDRTVARHGARPALVHRREGAWHTTTWARYREHVQTVARALIALGVQPGEGVAIIGYNAPEWVYADLGAVFAGAIPAGIYTTSSAEQAAWITNHCDARVAFVEDAAQARKLMAERASLPKLTHIVQWLGTPATAEGAIVLSWAAFVARAEGVPLDVVEQRIAKQKDSDPCTLIYTSGTTGNPKGVLLSHHSVTWMAKTGVDRIGINESSKGVSYLPLSHIAEQLLTIHGPVVAGFSITFAESMDKALECLLMVRPTYFLGVPRVWEKIQAKMQAAGAAAPPLRRKIAAWARGIGLRAGLAEQRGEPMPFLLPVADKLVFSKVRARLGFDQCKRYISGAAPISRDTLDFFLSLRIPIFEVYGMSECTGPTTISTHGAYRTGTVGRQLDGSEVRIADDGEILIRGPHVMIGYFKDEASTQAALDSDGWLHSGDIGEIDADGYVRITDRKKELIITAGGENVAPQAIENALKAIPVVAQAVAIGDRRRFMAALLTLDPERVPTDAAACGSSARTPAEAARDAKFMAHLEKQVENVNKTLARVQSVRKIVVLPNELTTEGGELTPSLKLKRKVIAQKYSKEIEALYTEG